MTLRGSFASLLAALGLLALALPANAAVHRVKNGESIAAAIEKAQPGDVVEVEPGLYREALTVDVPNLTLRGIVRGNERPVLDGDGQLNDGVIASGDAFTMTGFMVRHYKGNGVTTQGVDGVFLSDLVIDDTGLYGVYPVQSRNITVTHCTVSAIRDAGIYVGESNHALVAFNQVHHNVAGIEIENTNDAEVRDNLVYENTAGILVFVLPNKVQKEGRRTRVHRNWVLNNNTPNFGDPNAIVGRLPFGLGIMVMGADDTVVEENEVKGNASVGIAVIRLAEDESAKDPELEPLPDRNRIGINHLEANGLSPHPFITESYGRGADVAWDGTGTGNCAELPDAATVTGVPLPTCDAAGASAQAAPGAGRPPGASEAAPGAAPGTAAGAGAASSLDTNAAASAASAKAAAVPGTAREAVIVRIQGMRYQPKHLEIRAGQTVSWVNEDAVTHTVTSGHGTTPTRTPLDSPFLRRGETYTHRFDEPGRYEYLCLPHADQAPMREATVTVVR